MMRDYDFEQDDGRWVAVSDMADADLVSCLQFGFELKSPEVPAPAIRERLLLEAFIRENNLRA